MPDHTLGPWRCELVTRGQWEVFGAHGTMVCRVAKYAHGNAVSADARLIAAAPELLATLKGLVDLLNDDLDPAQCAAWDAAVVAIAKAEGR